MDQLPNLGRESEMLEIIGLNSIDELFSDIPENVRFSGQLPLRGPQSEEEILRDATDLLNANVTSKNKISFSFKFPTSAAEATELKPLLTLPLIARIFKFASWVDGALTGSFLYGSGFTNTGFSSFGFFTDSFFLGCGGGLTYCFLILHQIVTNTITPTKSTVTPTITTLETLSSSGTEHPKLGTQ